MPSPSRFLSCRLVIRAMRTDPNTSSHLGAVSYAYNIGTYDVTNTQYAAFLNAVDPTGFNAVDPTGTNSLRLFDPGNLTAGKTMVLPGTEAVTSSIPATRTSQWSICVGTVLFWFTNWLTNGQTSGGTETGVYTLTGLYQ